LAADEDDQRRGEDGDYGLISTARLDCTNALMKDGSR
jgi:hypothetical protein